MAALRILVSPNSTPWRQHTDIWEIRPRLGLVQFNILQGGLLHVEILANRILSLSPRLKRLKCMQREG
jgi:hypothetical protein